MRYCAFFFFFNDTAPTEIYTLPLHDALPISELRHEALNRREDCVVAAAGAPAHLLVRLEVLRGQLHERRRWRRPCADRKSTRLNSSHANISYAVFCLKKKKKHS